MSKIILFSEPNPSVLEKITPELFESSKMQVAYMPSDGSNESNAKYEKFWREYIESNSSGLVSINNSLRGEATRSEKEKVHASDALVLTGGNTFQFLSHLRESGLDQTIIEFSKTDKTILGFSAGAIVLSPTIEIATLPTLDENAIRLKDLKALGIVDFDVYPHYDESHDETVDRYISQTGREVIKIADDEVVLVRTDCGGEIEKL